MIRIIYDKVGKAYEYKDGVLVWVREGLLEGSQAHARHPAILPDLAPFVSPIDGSVVSGRAALRDHCRRHDVVPTSELAGLPPKPMVRHDYSPEYREATRRTIAEIINSRSYRDE